jgi:outer membrane protein
MKKTIAYSLIAVAAAFALPASTFAQSVTIKIGTVDMKKVFESYYKTKDAEAKINEARNNAKKELEDRMEQAKKQLEEVKKLDEEIKNPALSEKSREEKAKVRGEKAAELQTMDREIREFQASREKQLQEQSVRMRGGIVEEINKVIEAKVKADNYDLVFDKSGPSLNGVPVVLYSKETYEFTNDVVKQLNANKGKEEPAAAAAPAAAKPEATPKKK